MAIGVQKKRFSKTFPSRKNKPATPTLDYLIVVQERVPHSGITSIAKNKTKLNNTRAIDHFSSFITKDIISRPSARVSAPHKSF
jgi:hypothetical protein